MDVSETNATRNFASGVGSTCLVSLREREKSTTRTTTQSEKASTRLPVVRTRETTDGSSQTHPILI